MVNRASRQVVAAFSLGVLFCFVVLQNVMTQPAICSEHVSNERTSTPVFVKGPVKEPNVLLSDQEEAHLKQLLSGSSARACTLAIHPGLYRMACKYAG